MKTAKIAAAAAVTVATTGCENVSAPEPVAEEFAATTAVFDCDSQYGLLTFTTRTVPQGLALWLPLEFQKPYLVLERTPAASGARYERHGIVVWLHGEEAMLEVDDERISGCRRNPRASIWEHAKLNGVDFRATGNEPGWVLEISEKNRFDLRYDYDQSRIRAVAASTVNDQAARSTTYEMRVNGQHLVVEISALPCSDSMSGEAFGSTVVIHIDDRILRGCGRALH